MRRILIIAAVALVALIAWSGLVAGAAIYGWGRAPLAPRGDAAAFLDAAADRLMAENAGNGAIALIEDGRVVGMRFQSRGDHVVDGDSLFQVASLSKWATAWGAMTLVEQGKLDLDAPVSRYLTRWRLPESPYNDQVTVRRLLSHTAGLVDGLGYGGFAPGQPIDTLEQSLTRASDASPGRDGVVRVGAEPGTAWRYSGGGYTLLQLIVEEVSGQPFNDYMRAAVLAPLGMTHSTYVLDDQTRPRAVPIFDATGAPATHYTFAATGAASLYTSANDMARFLQAQAPGPNGEPAGRGVLRPETLAAMRAPHGYQYGIPIWGLGVILFAPNGAGEAIIGHDGNNFPAINTAARVDPASGDGIVVLETGAPLLATQIGGDWVFWKTGENDLLTVQMNLRTTIAWLVSGWIAIVLAAILAAIFWRRRKARPA